jgi:hypothetical protein
MYERMLDNFSWRRSMGLITILNRFKTL